MLAVEWVGNGRALLVYDHWGSMPLRGEAFDWADSAIHHVRIEVPSLAHLDSPNAPVGGDGSLRVSVDGETVWNRSVPFFYASSNSVSLCQNPTGFSTAATELSGAVISLHQELPDRR
jgi:hypothetical protein